jgi:hypothetical protein
LLYCYIWFNRYYKLIIATSSNKIIILKLKSATNYEIWVLRTKSFLIKERLKDLINNTLPIISQDINDKALANIRLLIEDGPLLQIQYITTAKEA